MRLAPLKDPRLLLSWLLGVCLIAATFYGATSRLWTEAESARAASTEKTVVAALAGDLAEGNLFKLGATVLRLKREGQLRSARIFAIRDAAASVLFQTPEANGLDEALSRTFRCKERKRVARRSGGGVDVWTILPARISGFDCVALYFSSDLPPELDLFKSRLLASSGGLILVLIVLFSWLALSWHHRILNLELAASRMKVEKESAIEQIAAQVAHDIRSPLAALEIVSGAIAQLPEDKRILIRAAVGRIRDIANNLLDRRRARVAGAGSPSAASVAPEAASPRLLSSLIDPVVSEKRLQFRSHSRVDIEPRLDASSYGLFAAVQPVEFKRLLSNLVNNAVEAFGEGAGAVSVSLSAREGRALVSVQDNGKGIPPEVLAKLGRRGETHGKVGGSGLGLYHARSSAESWGGSLELSSEVGKGTTAILALPLAPAPGWFVPELLLAPGKAVVILDDDESIHQVWQGRLDALRAGAQGVPVVHVSTPDEIRDWVKNEAAAAREALYLFDYELLGHRETGLALAEELGLGERVVLVTSRYEESEVLEGCRRLRARMIPKGLAGFVPIRVQAAKAPPAAAPDEKGARLDAVLIDDDALVRMNWSMAAKREGKSFKTYADAASFLAELDAGAISTDTPVYIDSNLADGVKGEVVALEINRRGFKRIRLATGHDPSAFAPMPHILEVIGKEPPWGAT
ncbi:MAG: hypothetical protein A2X40_07065 [Elusimicrobia bacterium GWC2_65_9]|nr:MAG: hypothetical protein A2X37_06455 [Elusimicrobia bacterium GWA2_66_18]OGR72342.1 MAG: hypothetical protein A2X40_07065 [Elusimicrobia bacterium GWC2_65_9]